MLSSDTRLTVIVYDENPKAATKEYSAAYTILNRASWNQKGFTAEDAKDAEETLNALPLRPSRP